MTRRKYQTPKSAGAHGGDFAIGGETAESDEDADQHTHGNGVGEGDRDGEEEDLRDAGQRGAVADYQFEDAAEVAGEKNESKTAAPIKAWETTSPRM